MTSVEAADKWQESQQSGKSAFGQGDFVQAERSWSAALEEARKLGAEDPRVVRSLTDLAGVYRAQGKDAEAQSCLEEALAITEKLAGSDNPRVAVILNNLGAACSAQRRHWDAEAAYRRALSIVINAYGPFHPSVATSLNNLADLYRAQGRYIQTEPMYRYVLAIYEFTDPHSIQVAAVCDNLARLLCARGKYWHARPLLERALALEKPGQNKVFFENMRSNYAELLKRTDRGLWNKLKRLFKPGA